MHRIVHIYFASNNTLDSVLVSHHQQCTENYFYISVNNVQKSVEAKLKIGTIVFQNVNNFIAAF